MRKLPFDNVGREASLIEPSARRCPESVCGRLLAIAPSGEEDREAVGQPVPVREPNPLATLLSKMQAATCEIEKTNRTKE